MVGRSCRHLVKKCKMKFSLNSFNFKVWISLVDTESINIRLSPFQKCSFSVSAVRQKQSSGFESGGNLQRRAGGGDGLLLLKLNQTFIDK